MSVRLTLQICRLPATVEKKAGDDNAELWSVREIEVPEQDVTGLEMRQQSSYVVELKLARKRLRLCSSLWALGLQGCATTPCGPQCQAREGQAPLQLLTLSQQRRSRIQITQILAVTHAAFRTPQRRRVILPASRHSRTLVSLRC